MSHADDEFRKKVKARAAVIADRKPIFEGEVYLVDDSKLWLPNEARTVHEARHVVVLQAGRVTNTDNQKTVLVLPCSTSVPPGPVHHELVDENGFKPGEVSVFVSLIQPMLKSLLTHRTGVISKDAQHRLRSQLLLAVGIPVIES